jgi:hypothetical protein
LPGLKIGVEIVPKIIEENGGAVARDILRDKIEGRVISRRTPERVVGLGQPDSSGVNGQLSAILIDAEGNQRTVSTTLYGNRPI